MYINYYIDLFRTMFTATFISNGHNFLALKTLNKQIYCNKKRNSTLLSCVQYFVNAKGNCCCCLFCCFSFCVNKKSSLCICIQIIVTTLHWLSKKRRCSRDVEVTLTFIFLLKIWFLSEWNLKKTFQMQTNLCCISVWILFKLCLFESSSIIVCIFSSIFWGR